MDQSEIEAVRALLSSKPRPIGWTERRQRLDEVGSVWPVADDIKLEPVEADRAHPLGFVPKHRSSRHDLA